MCKPSSILIYTAVIVVVYVIGAYFALDYIRLHEQVDKLERRKPSIQIKIPGHFEGEVPMPLPFTNSKGESI